MCGPPKTTARRSAETSKHDIGAPATNTAFCDLEGRYCVALGVVVPVMDASSPVVTSGVTLPRSLRMILDSRLYMLAALTARQRRHQGQSKQWACGNIYRDSAMAVDVDRRRVWLRRNWGTKADATLRRGGPAEGRSMMEPHGGQRWGRSGQSSGGASFNAPACLGGSKLSPSLVWSLHFVLFSRTAKRQPRPKSPTNVPASAII